MRWCGPGVEGGDNLPHLAVPTKGRPRRAGGLCRAERVPIMELAEAMDSFFGYTRPELALELEGRCRNPTRVAYRLFRAVYRRRIQAWDDVVRLPHRVRRWLGNEVGIERPLVVARTPGRDASELVQFRLSDGLTTRVELSGHTPSRLPWAWWCGDGVAALGRRGLFGRMATACLGVDVPEGATAHGSDLELGPTAEPGQLAPGQIVAQVVALLRLAPVTHLVLSSANLPADGPDSRVCAREILCDPAGLGYAVGRVALLEELR